MECLLENLMSVSGEFKLFVLINQCNYNPFFGKKLID
jgi:hypothetical protein